MARIYSYEEIVQLQHRWEKLNLNCQIHYSEGYKLITIKNASEEDTRFIHQLLATDINNLFNTLDYLYTSQSLKAS